MQDPLELVHLRGFTIREIPTRSIHCYIVRAWLGPEARVWPATVAAGLVVWRSTVYLQVMGFNLSVRPRGRNAIWRGIGKGLRCLEGLKFDLGYRQELASLGSR
jgi:hypothetical protein